MRRQRGFTLVEIVVAFVLLSLVLATSYQLFSTGMARAVDLDDYSRALEIAQTQIAQASIGDQFEAGETSGESEDERFRWVMTIGRGDDSPDPSQRVYSSFSPIRIGVRVAWKSGAGVDKQLELATLVVGTM
jgi:general secretion pathway protein I